MLAELLVAARLAGALLAAYNVPIDVACYIGAVGDEQGFLVSSQRAVSGPRFGPPVARVGSPRAEVPGRHLDSARFEIEDLVNPYRAAEVLAGPWLATFRDDDLLAKLAPDWPGRQLCFVDERRKKPAVFPPDRSCALRDCRYRHRSANAARLALTLTGVKRPVDAATRARQLPRHGRR